MTQIGILLIRFIQIYGFIVRFAFLMHGILKWQKQWISYEFHSSQIVYMFFDKTELARHVYVQPNQFFHQIQFLR